MNWLLQMHTAQPVAHAIGVLALVCVAGMALGSLKVRGVGLGTAGVLFAGIAAVGLMAGAKFFSTVFSPLGALWLFAGLLVTVPPLLVSADHGATHAFGAGSYADDASRKPVTRSSRFSTS